MAKVDRAALVTDNLAFVHWMAKKYLKYAEYDALVSAGYLGLVQASIKFKPSKGKFSTYAYWWVKKEMLEAIRETGPVHIPSHKVDTIRPGQLSFDADDVWWGHLKDEGDLAVTQVETMEQSRHIREGLRYLTEREQEIIKWRFGLEGRDPLTLEEVGGRVNLSRERVRQIEAEALTKLEKVLP